MPSPEKAMAPHSSILAWKIPWTQEPGRLQSMGSLRVGHDWEASLSLFTFMHWRKKEKKEIWQGVAEAAGPGSALQNYCLGGVCRLVTCRCSRALPPRFRPSFFQLLESGWPVTHSKVPPMNCPWPKEDTQPRFHAPRTQPHAPSTGSPHPVTGPHGSLRYLAFVRNI